MEKTDRNQRKKREGRVVSKSGDKTIVILIERRVRHPLYGKEIRISKKVHVHDEENKAGIGDVVRVMETRPMSKLKRWRLTEVVSEAAR
jgi:small subunit ribosomal protein S17